MAGSGGVRAGAGRKSNAQKLLDAGFVAPFFGVEEQAKVWKSMLTSDDEKIVLDAAKYLTDRIYGKAPQAVSMDVKGEIGVQLVNSIPRPKDE